MEALSALKRLQELLQEGAEPFAKRVMLEISNPDIQGREATHDDAHASTPLLREIQEGAELIRVEVPSTFTFVDFMVLVCILPTSYRSVVPWWQILHLGVSHRVGERGVATMRRAAHEIHQKDERDRMSKTNGVNERHGQIDANRDGESLPRLTIIA